MFRLDKEHIFGLFCNNQKYNCKYHLNIFRLYHRFSHTVKEKIDIECHMDIEYIFHSLYRIYLRKHIDNLGKFSLTNI